MGSKASSIRRTTGKVPRLDLALGITITAVTQLEVWLQDAIRGGERVAIAAALLGATATLCWRRRAALACAAAMASALAFQAALTATDLNSAGWALALMVALYSIAAYCDTRRALLGLVILIAGIAARELRDLDSYSQDPMGNAFWWLLIFSWFVVGLYVRSRRRARQLGRVAVELEVESAANARSAVVEERARIAQELHDVVAQDVSAVVVQAEAAEELLDGHPERARESLQTIQRMSREALAEMRNVLGIMRDPSGEAPPAPQPTLDGLPALIARHRALGLPAGLRVEGTPRPLPPGLAVSAYRVVQESLTNVRKHAGGAPAHVTVTFTPHSLELEIADHGGDNGRGDGSGHGLPGMEERVRFFGGQFTAGSRPDGGFVVRASFPIPASSQR